MSEVPSYHIKHTPPNVFDEIYAKDEETNTYSRVFGNDGGSSVGTETIAKGVYSEIPPNLTDGESHAILIGESSQLITEIALFKGAGQPFETLKQPLTNTELRATAVPVSGPLTNAQFIAVTGAANAVMWDGVNASATLIAILKTMHEQGEALKRIGNETNTLLVQVAEHTRQIAINTDTTP